MTVQTQPGPNAVRQESLAMPAFHREAVIDPATLKEDKRAFDVVWSAGAEVRRFDWMTGQRYVEVLQVDDASVRLERLQSGAAPVLDSHGRWSLQDVIGVVEKGSVRIDGGKAYAQVRMSGREEVAGIVGDIRDGIIRNMSCGYVVHAFREEKRGETLYRVVTDWEPQELSFVPIGADADAGRRSADGQVVPDPKLPTYPCVATRAAVETPAPSSAAALARMRMRERAAGLSQPGPSQPGIA